MCESQASKDWRESIHKVIAEPTPTPSITVGTQVRLTGVVQGPTRKFDDAQGVLIHGSANEEGIRTLVFVKPEHLEVIRQPFKRGEVVWLRKATAADIAYQVLGDETDLGDVLLIMDSNKGGNKSFVAHHSGFERRP